MDPITSLEDAPIAAQAPRRRFPWGATVLLVLVLGLTGAFAWKVFSYYRQIKDGTIDPGTYALSRPSTTQALAALVANAQGSGTLATEDDPDRGDKDAAVTIVEFADFGCPYSKTESAVIHALAQQFPKDVHVIYRDFPIEDIHDGAELAAAAATCGDAQGVFWDFHDALFRAPVLTEESVLAIAEDLDLDMTEFVDCVNDPDTTAEYEGDLADGYAAGVRGTPTFFVNGEMIEGAVPFDLFVKIVEAFTS